ncbi:MAG: hypothetical protein LBD86_07685, partial [Spirochaetaceae bacterium]|nr:hypothetical protein [Spirochaetaceae bacterium]
AVPETSNQPPPTAAYACALFDPDGRTRTPLWGRYRVADFSPAGGLAGGRVSPPQLSAAHTGLPGSLSRFACKIPRKIAAMRLVLQAAVETKVHGSRMLPSATGRRRRCSRARILPVPYAAY